MLCRTVFVGDGLICCQIGRIGKQRHAARARKACFLSVTKGKGEIFRVDTRYIRKVIGTGCFAPRTPIYGA